MLSEYQKARIRLIKELRVDQRLEEERIYLQLLKKIREPTVGVRRMGGVLRWLQPESQ